MTDVDGSEALLQFLYRAPIGLLQTTLDGTVEMINPMSARLLMPITATGDLDNLFEALSQVAPGLRAKVDAFGGDAGVVCEGLRFEIGATPRQAPRVLSISMLKVDAARLMVSLADATEEARREQAEIEVRLERAARVDALTRMPNRVAIAEAMRTMLDERHEARGTFAVLMVGCERLAEIAESFGDDIRDQVLELMARRLRSLLRANDGLCCVGDDCVAARTGGDEFGLFLRGLRHPADALLVAQRVLDALGKPYAVGPHPLHCAVSVGIVQPTDDDADPDDLLRDAAIAMREAKRVGGSRWVEFDPPMRERAVRRGSLEVDLRYALAGDELFVVYQPVVALQGDDPSRPRTAAVEALVRWRTPERGVIPPIEFIGLAEETGLIGVLGRFVLETACRNFVEWTKELGEHAPALLAVNLSRAQLADSTLVEQVRTALEESGMAPERLQLEITESLAAQDDGVQAQLQDLRALGVKLALDDFGTGYSSLSSLHLLPIDTVKIDRSFVTLAESSPHHRVLIEATIKVARSLGMDTVAEGIETGGQAAIVRELGCDKAQGYLYARPLTADALRDWLATR